MPASPALLHLLAWAWLGAFLLAVAYRYRDPPRKWACGVFGVACLLFGWEPIVPWLTWVVSALVLAFDIGVTIHFGDMVNAPSPEEWARRLEAERSGHAEALRQVAARQQRIDELLHEMGLTTAPQTDVVPAICETCPGRTHRVETGP